MATGDADALFLDTNVLVYANVASAPLHDKAVETIRAHYQADVKLRISRQVLREYLATFSRLQAFTNRRPVTTLVERVRYFESRFLVAEDRPLVTAQLLVLMEQLPIGGKQVHDANIVASMRVHGIGRLLTVKTGDFARFAHLITVLRLEAAS